MNGAQFQKFELLSQIHRDILVATNKVFSTSSANQVMHDRLSSFHEQDGLTEIMSYKSYAVT